MKFNELMYQWGLTTLGNAKIHMRAYAVDYRRPRRCITPQVTSDVNAKF